MVQIFNPKDARDFQIAFLFSFLLYGIHSLEWDIQPLYFMATLVCTIVVQLIGNHLLGLSHNNWKSAIITALGLTLLLRTNSLWILLLAACLSIVAKFIFRYMGRHFINPANFGIVTTILLTHQAWISPGQWGSAATLFFFVGTLGFIVLSKAHRIDIAIAFIGTLFLLQLCRSIYYLNWPIDHLIHQFTNGSLLLFTFFMITDPSSTPQHKWARRIWAAGVACLAFYLSNYKFIQGAPIWSLFILSFTTPLFTAITHNFSHIKFHILNFQHMKRISVILLVALVLIQQQAQAFCGFYVAKADTKLFNNKSQVILVRDGDRTVITMNNDFKGNVKDFAMVIPVPVVLQEKDVKVAEQILFDKLDAYSAPRLVEYFDNNPCQRLYEEKESLSKSVRPSMAAAEVATDDASLREDYKVKIEAKYSVGEYDIIVLSAKESNGLQRWLDDNGYQIPPNAQEVLEPYIKSNTKFFVAKVNLDQYEGYGDYTPLRPLQISFNSPKFMLPIRLGMANSTGTQDLIIYSFTKQGRVECTNYRTTKFPTGFKVPEFVEEKFGKFYADMFTRRWKREDRNVVFTEYAWDISGRNFQKCDPCVSDPPNGDDLRDAGVWWLDRNNNNWGGSNYTADVYFTRLHVRYDREHFPQDLVFNTTQDKSNFQARYVITHAAQGDLSCNEGRRYIHQVTDRREEELKNLYAYAGWNPSRYDYYMDEFENKLDTPYKNYRRNMFNFGDADGNINWGLIALFFSLCTSVIIVAVRSRKKA